MSLMPFTQLFLQHHGKVSDKWSLYLSEYERIFAPYRRRHVSLLEIGVQNGGSLEIYAKYFSNAKAILGCDINPACGELRFDDPRVTVIIGDAKSREVQTKILDVSPELDLVIDDGSHRSSDVVGIFARYFGPLRRGGVYIVEDLHCSYWDQFEGGLFSPHASISFFKKLADVINHEHWGIDKARVDLLSVFVAASEVQFDEALLAQIHSIEFINSMCVIRKEAENANQLGPQYIAGIVESVHPGRKELHGSSALPLDQIEAFFATDSSSLELLVIGQNDRLANLAQTVAARDAEIAALTQTSAQRQQLIADLSHAGGRHAASIAILQEALSQRDAQLDASTQRRIKCELRITDLERALDERDSRIATLTQTVTDREDRNAALTQVLVERDLRITSLETALTERDARLAELANCVAHRDQELLAIRRTASWRWTSPFRRVRAFLLQRQPSDSRLPFDPAWYLRKNEDVARSGMDPYEHYSHFGRFEGRSPRPDPIVTRNLKRLQVVATLLPSFLHSSGGVLPAGARVLKVLSQEGWPGVANRVSTLKARCDDSGRPAHLGNAYKRYIAAMEPIGADLEVMANRALHLSYRPRFSIVVPVYNVDARWLTRFVKSVLAQVYPDWELCIADDASTLPHVRPLLRRFAAKDSRIHLVFRDSNGHISEATNSALELATGDFMCLMDHDDEIPPHALYEFASLLNRDDSIDMIYSDEDKIDTKGNRYEPFFKPDWSPETLEGCMYTAHFACYRMGLVRAIGGFRSSHNGAQDYDFVLRFTERASKVVHVPKILYHWRAIPGSTAATMNAKDYVLDAGSRALLDRAERLAGGGSAKLGSCSGSFDLRYKVTGAPLVSIVIPSAGRKACVRGKEVDLLTQVVTSVCKRSTYHNFEIIVVDNNDLSSEAVEAVTSYGCRTVHFDEAFNIAKKMNLGARAAHGDYLLFLNDDIEVIEPDWLECMLQLCQRSRIGVVGAKLHFEDGSLQHVGVAFWNGLPDHIHRRIPGTDPGHFFSAITNRNYLAVTGAALMTERALFEELGGFDERFAVNYNDIDYCLRVFKHGLRVVASAGARLYHYESVSRERVVAQEEIALFQERWADFVSYDPYYSNFFDSHPPMFALRNDWSPSLVPDPLESPAIVHRVKHDVSNPLAQVEHLAS